MSGDINVTIRDEVVTATVTSDVISIDIVGGGVGSSAATQYEHNQQVASATWTIVHNLGFKPGGILIIDTNGDEVEGAIQHVDTSTTIITFSALVSGTATLS